MARMQSTQVSCDVRDVEHLGDHTQTPKQYWNRRLILYRLVDLKYLEVDSMIAVPHK